MAGRRAPTRFPTKDTQKPSQNRQGSASASPASACPLNLYISASSPKHSQPSPPLLIQHQRQQITTHPPHPNFIFLNSSLHDSRQPHPPQPQNATKGRSREEARQQGTRFQGTRREEGSWQEDRCHWREEEAHQDPQGDILFIYLQRYVQFFFGIKSRLSRASQRVKNYKTTGLDFILLHGADIARCLTFPHYLTFAILVLKQVHPDTGISNRAMSILNSFVNGMHTSNPHSTSNL